MISQPPCSTKHVSVSSKVDNTFWKALPCLYWTIITVKFTGKIYQYFLRLEIFTDKIYQYFLWLAKIPIQEQYCIVYQGKYRYIWSVKNCWAHKIPVNLTGKFDGWNCLVKTWTDRKFFFVRAVTLNIINNGIVSSKLTWNMKKFFILIF